MNLEKFYQSTIEAGKTVVKKIKDHNEESRTLRELKKLAVRSDHYIVRRHFATDSSSCGEMHLGNYDSKCPKDEVSELFFKARNGKKGTITEFLPISEHRQIGLVRIESRNISD